MNNNRIAIMDSAKAEEFWFCGSLHRPFGGPSARVGAKRMRVAQSPSLSVMRNRPEPARQIALHSDPSNDNNHDDQMTIDQ